MKLKMEHMVMTMQKKIRDELQRIDGKDFKVDRWTRASGGGGVSCILQEGNVFEKAGVNVSVVHGMLPPAAMVQVIMWSSPALYIALN